MAIRVVIDVFCGGASIERTIYQPRVLLGHSLVSLDHHVRLWVVSQKQSTT